MSFIIIFNVFSTVIIDSDNMLRRRAINKEMRKTYKEKQLYTISLAIIFFIWQFKIIFVCHSSNLTSIWPLAARYFEP